MTRVVSNEYYNSVWTQCKMKCTVVPRMRLFYKLSSLVLTSTVMSQLSFGITDIPWSSQRGCSGLVAVLISSVQRITLNTHWSSSEQQLQWFSQAPVVLVFEFSSTIHLSLQGFGRHGARLNNPADISVCCKHLPFLSPCFPPLARDVPTRLIKH